MDAAKARRWKELRAQNVTIPVAYDRQNSHQNETAQFCISFKGVDGIAIKGEEKACDLQLRAFLYDTSYKQFFGRAWKGPVVAARPGANGRLKLAYNQACHFYTSVSSQSVAVVVELVHNVQSGKQRVPSSSISRGWALIRLLSPLGDASVTGSQNDVKLASAAFYHGTPRALLQMDEPLEENELLQQMSGCVVSYQLMSHQTLQRVSHLLPENFLLGSDETLPGIAEMKKESSIIKRLRPARQVKAFVDKVIVNFYPDVSRFEEELVKLLNEDRANRDSRIVDGLSTVIVERRLQVGVHNGLCYVEKPEMVLLVSHDVTMRRGAAIKKPSHQRTSSTGSLQQQQSPARTSGSDRALVLRDRVPLNGFAHDPALAVVFVIEYLVSEPVSPEDRKISRTLAKTRTYAVCVRWTAWSPSDSPPGEGDEVQVSLIGGPSAVPDNSLVYKMPDIAMESFSTSRDIPGWLNFTFVDAQGGAGDEGGLVPVSAALGHGAVSGLLFPAGTSYGEGATALESSVSRPPMAPRIAKSLPLRDSGLAQGSTHATVSQPVLPSQLAQRPMQQHEPKNQVEPPPVTGGITGKVAGSKPLVVAASVQPFLEQQQQQSYARQPLGPSSAVYPMEILHYRQNVATSDGAVDEGDMQELPYTPVHAPVVSASQLGKSASGLSRAAYARLYSAGFPQILDRHKDTPEVVDPGDAVSFSLQKEEADILQCNEIVFQFLAFARTAVQGSSLLPATLYFTFQFYRFPQVKTDRLLLGTPERDLSTDRASQPCVLYKINPDGSVKSGPPGYQLKYHVDPAFLKPGEARLFVQHLYNQTLHIDVWDGDTLLLVGSCALELKHLCRQGREAVQCTYELDVVSTDVSDETALLTGDLTRGGSVRPVGISPSLRGKLHLRLANIGHPADAEKNVSSAAGLGRLIMSNSGDKRGSFFGGSLNAGVARGAATRRVARAEHLSRVSQELASMLRHSHIGIPATIEGMMPDATASSSGPKDRKLARMDAVRAALGKGADDNKPLGIYLSHKQQKEERARDLRLMEMYRSQLKKEGIVNMLNMAITTEHVIHPTLGAVEFFEFQLRNPHNVQHTVTIMIEDPDLSVITDAREWRYYKHLNNLQTPIEEGMFSAQPTQHPEVFMRPKETVNIPFRFVTMRASHAVPLMAASDDAKSFRNERFPSTQDNALSTRVIHAFFKTKDVEHLIAVLSLRAEPQPHVVDQTFRFYHPEQSFLKKSIRLPPFHRFQGSHQTDLVSAVPSEQLFVRCSDPNVICESRKMQQGEPQDVFVKVALGLSPQVKTFFVCVYCDAFMARPTQIWQIYVHALQRIDVSCTEGQTSRLSLILRGTQSSRLVHCYSSHVLELALHPSEPFVLAAGAVHEVHLSVRPLASGSRFFYVNVVDVECHQLVRCWLVCVSTRPPLISKAFELTLPAGGGKSSNKRISYTNPYGESRVFNLVCNRSDLVQFKESRLEMTPYETKVIGLRFSPVSNPGSVEVLIFINDSDDKNEETFSIKAVYRHAEEEEL